VSDIFGSLELTASSAEIKRRWLSSFRQLVSARTTIRVRCEAIRAGDRAKEAPAAFE
jgi:hypothetical protein